ncbi:MAG: histidinol-phosphate transaminase, partial [Lutibacter sp.]|nr:histidinol-phosphate transaminase [Lutibacter sp.]
KNVQASQILLGNGSDEVLDLIFRAFCEPAKDKVIILPPTYGMYKVLANTNDIEVKEVCLTTDFQPMVGEILLAMDAHTKLLLLCSPNNPTGNLLSRQAIETLLNTFDGLVVIDEAYIDFSSQESWLHSLEAYPNLIITQTFSKAYGMAGIRLGVCYASEAIIAVLNKIKPPYNVNSLTQRYALKRLRNLSRINRETDQLLKQRALLAAALEKIAVVEKVYPTDANFILVRVDDADKRYQQLIDLGIVVRNRSTQPLCHNTLRLTVGSQRENKKLINALKNL